MALSARLRSTLVAGALVLLVLAVFWPSRRYDWLNYDDPVYVTANPGVLQGLSAEGVRWAFTTTHGANWFPLTWLSWQADVERAGLDRSAFATTSIVLHALATLALFLAFRRMTGDLWPSAFVAAVFGLHPLHVEPVAWIAARKDPLAGLFFALALLVYAPARERPPSPARLTGVALCLTLGLLAKQMVVTLPIVLLLLDGWPLGRLRDRAGLRRCVIEKLPLFALACAGGVMTIVAQGSGGAIADFEQLSLGRRLANAVVSFAVYLGQTFWPRDLAVFYPHPRGQLSAFAIAGSALLLIALSGLAWRAARRHPAVTVGWLWFVITLLPVIGIVQVGSQAHADRYMYLPLVGLAIAVAWGVPALARRLPLDPRRRTAALGTVALAAVAALAVDTTAQLSHWRDSESLMRRAIAVTGPNFIAHGHLGDALLSQGRAAEAAAELRESARIEPSYATVTNNLAWLLATYRDPAIRSPQEAVHYAQLAVRSAPDDPAVLDTLAAAYASAGRFDQAADTATRAARMVRDLGEPELAEQIEKRRALYRRGRAWVER